MRVSLKSVSIIKLVKKKDIHMIIYLFIFSFIKNAFKKDKVEKSLWLKKYYFKKK